MKLKIHIWTVQLQKTNQCCVTSIFLVRHKRHKIVHSVCCMSCVLRLDSWTCSAAAVAKSSLYSLSVVLSLAATDESSVTRECVACSFDSKLQTDEPIACIMSTAELTAFLTVSTSAFAPPVTGRRNVLALRASIAPDKEVE